jgi:hypothetical protein
LLPILVSQARNLPAFRIDLPGLFFNCAGVLFGFAFNLVLRTIHALSLLSSIQERRFKLGAASAEAAPGCR